MRKANPKVDLIPRPDYSPDCWGAGFATCNIPDKCTHRHSCSKRRDQEIAKEKKEKVHKYHAVPVDTPDGEHFDSTLEYRCVLFYRKKQKQGLIRDIVRQPHFDLIVNGKKIGRGYKGDLAYYDMDGRYHVVDAKGKITRDWPKVRDLMKACHGIDIELWPARKKKRRKK